jgi:hypothetical protein
MGKFDMSGGEYRILPNDETVPKDLYTAATSIVSAVFSVAAVDLIDATTFQVTEEESETVDIGIAHRVTLTTLADTGTVTLEFFSDVARLNLIYTMTLDMTDQSTWVSTESFGCHLSSSGRIYGTVYTSGVGVGLTCDITVDVLLVSPGDAPLPMVAPYGYGLTVDGFGRPQIWFDTTSGLEFHIGQLQLKCNDGASVHPVLTTSGIEITGAVDTTTDEDVSAKKRFDSVGLVPSADAGPPIAGTYAACAEYMDKNYVKWRCVSGGTPGDWELADNVFEGSLADIWTVGAVAPGFTDLIQIPTTGNCGVIHSLQVWAHTISEGIDACLPFRVRIFPNSNEFGREMLWQGQGLSRQTYSSVTLPAGQGYIVVNDNNMMDVDEAIVVYESQSRYELGRISARPTGQFTLDESLEDSSDWTGNLDIVSAAEWSGLPWYNNAFTNCIYLQVKNDAIAAEDSLYFCVRAQVMSYGVNR